MEGESRRLAAHGTLLVRARRPIATALRLAAARLRRAHASSLADASIAPLGLRPVALASFANFSAGWALVDAHDQEPDVASADASWEFAIATPGEDRPEGWCCGNEGGLAVGLYVGVDSPEQREAAADGFFARVEASARALGGRCQEHGIGPNKGKCTPR